MTPHNIRNMINDGILPSFGQINKAFPDHPGISWHIRLAAQGALDPSITACQMLLGANARWTVSYDNKATVSARANGIPDVCISTTPGHALIIATLDAYIAEGA